MLLQCNDRDPLNILVGVHRHVNPSVRRVTLPTLFHEANSSGELIEKFGDRLFRDLATLTVLKQACVTLKDNASESDRYSMRSKMLNRTEQIARAMASIDCGEYASPIASATMLQLSNHAAIALRHVHNEEESAIQHAVKLLPSLDALTLETIQCRHADAFRLLADALMLFSDDESDVDEVRRYYSDEYNEVKYVLNAYIEQLSSGGSALPTAVS